LPDLIPGPETRIPPALGELSPCAAVRGVYVPQQRPSTAKIKKNKKNKKKMIRRGWTAGT
jgi:hypothetical protein